MSSFSVIRVLLVVSIATTSLAGEEVEGVDSVTKLNDLISSSSFSSALVVRFYSGKDKKTKAVSDAYVKIAKAFESLPVQFVSVDVDEVNDVLKSQGLKAKDLPAIKLFLGRKVSITYKDAFGTKVEEIAQNVINWVFEEVKRLTLESVGLKYIKPKKEKPLGSGVVELTESNFNSKVIDVSPDTVVLVEFFAPWCGHCKSLAPTYAQIAKTVHGDPETYGEKTIVASVDATVHQSLSSQYGIQGFPTIKLFVGGKLKADYKGPRDASSIQDFIRSNIPPKIVESDLIQLTDFSSDFESNCLSAPLCILSFLPNLYDCNAKCRKGYLDLLKSEATEENGIGFGRGWLFIWLDGGLSEEMIKFEEDLGVGPGVGYPNMVVINGKKEKYSPMRGSFSKQGIREFLKGIIYGGKGASPLYPLPPTDKLLQRLKSSGQTVIKDWDGKDAPPLEDSKDEL